MADTTFIQKISRNTNNSLPTIYSECFILILHLQQTKDYGNAELLRQRLKDLLSQLEYIAKDSGYDQESIDHTQFALVAFIDETISSSEWKQKAAWLANPLQLELFNTLNAGNEFFMRLEHIKKSGLSCIEILKVYYHCLALGYRGKFHLMEHEKARILLDELYIELQQAVEHTDDLLSPHGLQQDSFYADEKKEVSVWTFWAVAFVIGFFFYFVLTFIISSEFSELQDRIDMLLY